MPRPFSRAVQYRTAVSDSPVPEPSAVRRMSLLPLAAVLALVAMAIARITGPSDLWDQTQPRTIAYTVDMLVHGGESWVLARDAQGVLATKPPLYNWLAAPGVALLGRQSEFAHRLPSLLATIAVVVLLVRWGERQGRGIGWLAALAWVAMFPTIKLGYLARPDMLLCLVMFIGWRAATAAINVERTAPALRRQALLYWLAFALAAWTKGPAAICLLLYPPILSLVLHRSLAPLGRLYPLSFGLPGMALAGLWYAIAAWISPEHFRETLIYGEVVGRMTGNGPEGGGEGPMAIVIGFPVMTLYFFARFAPWSFLALLGAVALIARGERGERRWRASAPNAELLGAVLWTATIVLLFSFSSGKRADYIAPVYAPAALVAAWWMLRDPHSPIRSRPWIAVAIATVGMAIHIAVDRRGSVVSRPTMDHIEALVARSLAERRAAPETPLVVIAQQLPHVAVLCGDPAPADNSQKGLRAELALHGRALVLVATKSVPEPVRTLLAEGRARELWTMPFPADAAKGGMTYPAVMYEITAPPKDPPSD